MKQTWREINTIIGKGKKQSSQCEFQGDNGVITDPQEISNRFNNFFVNIGPKLASEIKSNGKEYHDYLHNMTSSNITRNSVKKAPSHRHCKRQLTDSIGNVINVRAL